MTPAAPEAIGGASAWTAADLGEAAEWTLPYSDDHEELARLIDERLFDGAGFAVVSGMPVAGEEDATASLLGLCRRMGELTPQTVDGKLVDRVRDEARATVRGAKTSRALVYHTDFATSVPDVFALLAVRAAKSGGESLVVSSHTVHDRLVDEAPEAARRLYGEFCFDRTGDVAPDDEPVLRAPVFQRDGGGVRTLYNRARMHRGHRAAGVPLGAEEAAALDAFDEVTARPENRLEFTLAPGAAIFANNRTILHNRRAFADPDPSEGRLLLRVWVRHARFAGG